MNNLPAMTEAQRQELIELCEADILCARTLIIAAINVNDNETKAKWESQLLRQQIALAALTSPPAPVLRVPDGWIKYSERYPELGQEVLIRVPVCEKFNIENGKYEGDGRFLGAWFDTRGKGRPYKVTHWMPLPPPPEASNEQ